MTRLVEYVPRIPAESEGEAIRDAWLADAVSDIMSALTDPDKLQKQVFDLMLYGKADGDILRDEAQVAHGPQPPSG